MAVRIRKDGSILCAALHPESDGDTYLDDGLHYKLSVDLKVLVTQESVEHQKRGEWWWRDDIPVGVVIDPFYLPGGEVAP